MCYIPVAITVHVGPLLDEQEVGVATAEPSVYIVKYNYDPSTMSPNPSHAQELALVAGDYIYVYGGADDDGFYHAQLETGEEGLVPSNFVELVAEGGGERQHTALTCI